MLVLARKKSITALEPTKKICVPSYNNSCLIQIKMGLEDEKNPRLKNFLVLITVFLVIFAFATIITSSTTQEHCADGSSGFWNNSNVFKKDSSGNPKPGSNVCAKASVGNKSNSDCPSKCEGRGSCCATFKGTAGQLLTGDYFMGGALWILLILMVVNIAVHATDKSGRSPSSHYYATTTGLAVVISIISIYVAVVGVLFVTECDCWDWENSSMYDDEQTQLALASIVAALSVVVLVVASWYWHSSNERLTSESLSKAAAVTPETAQARQLDNTEADDASMLFEDELKSLLASIKNG